MRKPLPLLLPLLLAACATNSDLEQTRRQLESQLSQSSQQANSRLSDVEAKLANQRLLDLVNQVNALKGEIAALRGQKEVLQHQVAETQKRQNDLYGDLDMRVGKLEKQWREASQPVAEAPAEAQPPAPVAANPAEAALNTALEALRNRDFVRATGLLKTVTEQHAGSSQAVEAGYWLGVAHTALKQYDAAIDMQRRFAEQNPKHLRAPDALRLMADNQLALQQQDQARATLKKLIKLYPASAAAQKAKQRLATL